MEQDSSLAAVRPWPSGYVREGWYGGVYPPMIAATVPTCMTRQHVHNTICCSQTSAVINWIILLVTRPSHLKKKKNHNHKCLEVAEICQ